MPLPPHTPFSLLSATIKANTKLIELAKLQEIRGEAEESFWGERRGRKRSVQKIERSAVAIFKKHFIIDMIDDDIM